MSEVANIARGARITRSEISLGSSTVGGTPMSHKTHAHVLPRRFRDLNTN